MAAVFLGAVAMHSIALHCPPGTAGSASIGVHAHQTAGETAAASTSPTQAQIAAWVPHGGDEIAVGMLCVVLVWGAGVVFAAFSPRRGVLDRGRRRPLAGRWARVVVGAGRPPPVPLLVALRC